MSVGFQKSSLEYIGQRRVVVSRSCFVKLKVMFSGGSLNKNINCVSYLGDNCATDIVIGECESSLLGISHGL